MVPQNPSQARGGPKNTHQGGAGGWENLQVVCVWPQQKAGERPVSPSPSHLWFGDTTCGPGTPIQDIPFSHGYLRDHEGGGGDILRPAQSSQFSASTLQDGDKEIETVLGPGRWNQSSVLFRCSLLLRGCGLCPERLACLSLSPLSFFFLGNIWVPRPQPPTFGRL